MEVSHVITTELLARAYERAPLYDLSAVDSYRALASDCVTLADRVRKLVRVVEVSNPEPYATADAMHDDIDSGYLAVSRANSEHPVFTVAENVAFRLAHDYFGHYRTRAGFDWPGEKEACKAQSVLLSSDAFPAFITECLGQTAYRVHYGRFTVQKVALLEL
jgi:hypothetical protein